jgi:hypothetical protein
MARIANGAAATTSALRERTPHCFAGAQHDAQKFRRSRQARAFGNLEAHCCRDSASSPKNIASWPEPMSGYSIKLTT